MQNCIRSVLFDPVFLINWNVINFNSVNHVYYYHIPTTFGYTLCAISAGRSSAAGAYNQFTFYTHTPALVALFCCCCCVR